MAEPPTALPHLCQLCLIAPFPHEALPLEIGPTAQNGLSISRSSPVTAAKDLSPNKVPFTGSVVWKRHLGPSSAHLSLGRQALGDFPVVAMTVPLTEPGP